MRCLVILCVLMVAVHGIKVKKEYKQAMMVTILKYYDGLSESLRLQLSQGGIKLKRVEVQYMKYLNRKSMLRYCLSYAEYIKHLLRYRRKKVTRGYFIRFGHELAMRNREVMLWKYYSFLIYRHNRRTRMTKWMLKLNARDVSDMRCVDTPW
ncbi:uncharacterized protein [Haliotis cracherodii]|uniref:uncharacterized protein n=1 Tax=Haliotis cracherodii TaxID=6455 RepID=UPI0039E9BDB3